MTYCIRPSCEMPCGEGEGWISVTWSTSSSAKPVGGACATGGGSNPEFIPGPVAGTVTMNGYAFDSRSSDLWLGSKCLSRAQAQQNHMIKYDGATDKHYIIPTSINSASITGEPVGALSMTVLCGGLESFEMRVAAGTTIGTALTTDIGHNLRYTAGPQPVSFPDMTAKTVMGQTGCYLSGFSFNSDYPTSPAQATYTFQFLADCGDGGGGGKR